MKELLLLSSLGIISLIAEILSLRKLIFPIVILGLLLNIGFCVNDLGKNENVYNMLVLDKVSLIFIILTSVVAILWFTMARNFFTDETNLSDHFSLVLFSLVGVFILITYKHLAMLFLGVEILSIPVYVLAGSNKRSLYSNESAFKYFLLGSFASGFLLLGIAFLYGATGRFSIEQIALSSVITIGISKQLLTVGLLLIFFAMAFKMSAVPFHFWAPDVYSGAPTVVTSYMATIVKIGAVAGFYRLFGIVLACYKEYTLVVLVVAVLTILLGNILAASQTNVKRMLAYSSIGHAGFLILGIAMLTVSTPFITWYYLLSYTLSSIAAFWVLMLLSPKENEEDISIFKGLVKRSPVLAFTMCIALLSMAGIPPLSGFFAKYFVLVNVIFNEQIAIAVVAILASLIGVYYYFKVIIAMFTVSDETASSIDVSTSNKVLLTILSICIILIGVMPDFILRLFFK